MKPGTDRCWGRWWLGAARSDPVGSAAGATGEPDGGLGAGTGVGQAELPCLWKRLRKHVSKTAGLREGRKIHVNDSKLVYSPVGGLKGTGDGRCWRWRRRRGVWPDDCDDLLGLLSRDGCPRRGRLGRVSVVPVRTRASRFRCGRRRCPSGCSPTRCGRRCGGAGPAASTSAPGWSASGSSTRCSRRCATRPPRYSPSRPSTWIHLLRTYGEQEPDDRLRPPGRPGALRVAAAADVRGVVAGDRLRETETRSDYVLTRNGHPVRLSFREKAEAQCMPVAVASMLSKYLREALMGRFNAWWKQHLPELCRRPVITPTGCGSSRTSTPSAGNWA